MRPGEDETKSLRFAFRPATDSLLYRRDVATVLFLNRSSWKAELQAPPVPWMLYTRSNAAFEELGRPIPNPSRPDSEAAAWQAGTEGSVRRRALEQDSDSRQPDLDELSRQVRDLQRRVRLLEQHAGGVQPEEASEAAPIKSPQAASRSLEQGARIVPVFGKALLGIAGAYLLRALTEFGLLPLSLGIASGILYALFWLVLAARTAPEERLVAGVHGATSVLILVPLLWEATIRFRAISTWAAAAVLVLFCVFGLAISWRKDVAVVAWITTLAGLFTATALLLATDDLAPFTLALLAMAAAVELSACLDHWLRERWIVALVADLSVLVLTYSASRPGGLPEGYAPIPKGIALAAPIALLAIYLLSTIVRTLLRGFTFTTFETTQWILAFLLSMGGALRVSHGEPAAVRAVAVFSLICGAACYLVSFEFLERVGKRNRNFHTYSTFALLLVFTGTVILLSGAALAAVLSVVGLTCLQIGRQARRTVLKWHGALYLTSAAVLSGLTAWATARLLATGAAWVPPSPAIWLSAVAALAGYVLICRGGAPWSAQWTRRLVVLVLAANAAWAFAGFAAGALIAAAGHLGGKTHIDALCPTLRTAVLTLWSLAIAWSGVRWRRFELIWLVYPFMAITAYKLMAQDLPKSETLALFASLFLYGGALVLLPRILQKGKRE